MEANPYHDYCLQVTKLVCRMFLLLYTLGEQITVEIFCKPICINY